MGHGHPDKQHPRPGLTDNEVCMDSVVVMLPPNHFAREAIGFANHQDMCEIVPTVHACGLTIPVIVPTDKHA
jgi:hypothetical protein